MRQPVNRRLDAVAALIDDWALARACPQVLKGAPDMSRALSRLKLKRGGPRDLGALRDGLAAAGGLAAMLAASAALPAGAARTSLGRSPRPVGAEPALTPAPLSRKGRGDLLLDADSPLPSRERAGVRGTSDPAQRDVQAASPTLADGWRRAGREPALFHARWRFHRKRLRRGSRRAAPALRRTPRLCSPSCKRVTPRRPASRR